MRRAWPSFLPLTFKMGKYCPHLGFVQIRQNKRMPPSIFGACIDRRIIWVLLSVAVELKNNP